MICLLSVIICLIKMICLLRYDYVHDEDDLFKYAYRNGECYLLLRCDCVTLCPVQGLQTGNKLKTIACNVQVCDPP
jgi:hypothetical protein